MGRKSGVLFSFLAIFFEVLSTLVLTPFLIKTLGQSEFGIYKMCISIIAYVLLLDLGIGNSIIRFASKYRFNNDKDNMEKLAGVSFVFYTIIGVLSLVAGVVIYVIFPYVFNNGLMPAEIELGKKLILITCVTSAITLTSSGFYNIIIAHERFFVSKGLNIIQNILKIIFSFIALKLGWGSIGVCFVALFTTLAVRATYILYVIFVLKIRPRLRGAQKAWIIEILSYSGLIAIQMVATQMNQSVDQIFIGALVHDSSATLGVYAVGAQLNQYFMSLGVAITGVLMPGIVKFMHSNPNPKDITNEAIRLGRLIFLPLAIIYAGFVIFGRGFISLWAGPENIGAFIVGVLLMTPQLFVSTCSPCLQMLWSINKQKELTWLKLAIVISNCFLTVVLIRWNPLVGASLGTFISVMIGDVVLMLVISKIKLKMKLSDFIFSVFFSISLTVFAVALVCNRILSSNTFNINGWGSLILYGAIFTALTLSSIYFICLNKYELDLLNRVSIIKKLARRLRRC